MMKLCTFLLFCCLFHASAEVYSQRASVRVTNESLKEVFRLLTKQTGYDFLYASDDLRDTRPVTLQVVNAPLDQILTVCLKDQPLTYRIENTTVLIRRKHHDGSLSSLQEEVLAEGRILGEGGTPLPGASVSAKGLPGRITSTDREGRYSLRVPAGSTLVITFVGYQRKEIPVTGGSQTTVLDVEDLLLSDVVIVGYGEARKENMVSSVVQVDSREIKTAPTATLSSMLQGRLPGLITRQSSGQPGADGASLLVRGYNTLGSNSPLIIIDGIERGFPNINPDEVESISVLKDAASAAVYGVRAANGVILITTKRGRAQKPTITYNSSFAASTNTQFPEFLTGAEYAYWYNKAQEMDGIAETARRFTADEIGRITNGDPEGVYGNTDWFDLLFRDYAPIYTNNLSLSGGNDKVKYFVSLGAYNQEGIIARTSHNRYNFRANLDANVADNFDVSFNLALRDQKNMEPGLSPGVGNSYASIFSQAMMSYPFLQPYNKHGMAVGSQNPGNGNQNPVAARDLSGENSTRNADFQGSVTLKYHLPAVPGLHFRVTGGYDKGYTMRKAYLLPYLLSVYQPSTRQFIDTYARHALTGDATLNQWFSDAWQTAFQPAVSYTGSFGKHAVEGLMLYEYIRDDNSSLSGGRRGYPITDIMDLNFGEEVIDNLVKGGHGMTHRAGYVTRLNYNYAGKYLFEFTSRLDGSPRLPADTRWGFFPAVALGWRMSDEAFLNGVGFLDDLKIRGSVGRLGNDAVGEYAYLRTMRLGVDPVVMIGDKLSRPLNVGGVPNEKIKWETTLSYNIGLESTLWNGLLGIEADAFYNVTKDILQAQSGLMPPSMGGYFPATVNSGIVDNRGLELILNHRHRIGELNYHARGNVSWARNRIIETTEDANVPDYLRRTGRQIGMKLGFVADGLFQTEEEIANSALFGPTRPGEVRLKDLNGDGRITWDQDWTYIGRSSIPEMMFGLNIGGDYRGFDFNVFLQGAALSDVALSGLYSSSGVYDNTFYTMAFYQDGNSPRYLAEQAWTPENPNARYPRLSTISAQSGGKFSSWWIRDGSYLRLKSAQIGYTLPAAVTNRMKVDRLRFHLSGSNLFTISGLDYLDPEMPDVNQGYYPQQRLYEFGLSLTF